MRRFLVLALFAGPIVCLTMPDASALGRRREVPLTYALPAPANPLAA